MPGRPTATTPSPPARPAGWRGRWASWRGRGRRRWRGKVAARVKGRLIERLRVGSMAGRPWRDDGRAVVLLVSHVGGGGTERHVREMADALRDAGARPVLARPDGAGRLLWEERDAAWRVRWCRATRPAAESAGRLLDLLAPAHAHVHHRLGHGPGLFDALAARGVPTDWTIHDYHAICPRIHLHRDDGSYCGEPDAAGCADCLARRGDYHGRPFRGSIVDWRAEAGRLLTSARAVFVPSEDVARRLRRHFPALHPAVRPHAEHRESRRWPPPRRRRASRCGWPSWG